MVMHVFPESYLAAIGRVIVGWARIEHSFDWLFLSVVVFKGRATGSMEEPHVKQWMGEGFKRKVKRFKARVRELDLSVDRQKEIRNVLAALSRYRTERDEIAHSLFDPAIKDGQIINDEASLLYKSWKSSKAFEYKSLTRGRLDEIAQEMEKLFWDLTRASLDLALAQKKAFEKSILTMTKDELLQEYFPKEAKE